MQWTDRIGRRLRLRDLHLLMAVARAGSMAQAARELAISQPVVSQTIADLERTLGIRLLDRTPHGVEPTLYGRALLKRGIVIFDELRESVKELEFLADPTAGELRIGCTDAIIAGVLPVIITRLRRRHPRVTFNLTQVQTGSALYEELRQRNVDLIIGRMMMPLKEGDLAAQVLFDDQPLVVSGLHSRWARRRRIEMAELIDETWSLPRPDTVAGALVAEAFRACGLEVPRAHVISNSSSMHYALVMSGQFLAMPPASTIWFGGKRLPIKILPVKLPAVAGPMGIITLKSRTISSVVQLFINCAREVTATLAKRGARGATT